MQFANARHIHMSVSTACGFLLSWILPEVYALEVHEGHQAQHILSLSRRQKEKSRRGGSTKGGSLSVEIDPHGAHQMLTPLEDMSSEYTGLVGVGTSASGGPQFEARVVFDTGSTNLWMASVLCKAYPCDEQHTSYDPASSITSEEYLDGSSRDIDIMFGTGELKGPLHVDTYHVGPMEVDHQPFAMIREMSGEVFASFPFEGILGLAFPSLSFGGITPFFERVIEKKLLKRNEFAFYLNADSSRPSALLWGGVDKDLYEGDILMFPVKKAHYWALELVDFRIGNRSLMEDEKHSKTKYLIVDTGTTYFTAPGSIYDEIIATLQEAPCPQVDSYVPLTYVLRSGSGDTFNLEVTQETYMVADDSEDCQPAFMKLDLKKQYGPAMILGEVFMRHFFTVFSRGNGDLTEAKVGFAKAKLGAMPKVSSNIGSVVQIQEASLMRRNPER